jgi:hypothetical protein
LPSPHDAAEHTLFAQFRCWQSVAMLHARPSAHAGHVRPPQSGAVSAPFLTLSEHVAATHTLLVHLPLPGRTQSAFTLQPLPTAHFVVQEPPQSTPVSVPFCTLSEHVGVWHTPLVHLRLVQSPLPEHLPASGHFGHVVPPQSTSVSVPLTMPSLHAAAWQTLLEQSPLAGVTQSPFTEQPAPTAHFVVHVPPQSTAVSVPFSTLSLQVAATHTLPVHLPLEGSAQSPLPAHA